MRGAVVTALALIGLTALALYGAWELHEYGTPFADISEVVTAVLLLAVCIAVLGLFFRLVGRRVAEWLGLPHDNQ